MTLETTRPLTPGVQPLTDAGRRHFAVDGVEPRLLAAPGGRRRGGQAARLGGEQRLAVATRGGGTRTALGNVPRALRPGRLDREAEQRRRVRAGRPDHHRRGRARRSRTCRRCSAEQGQFLALDPPAATGATLGRLDRRPTPAGRCASPTARARPGHRHAGGNPDGTVTHAGGRVVKNVAGYDLNKLYIGSLGTLGVIDRAELQAAPIPPATTHRRGAASPTSTRPARTSTGSCTRRCRR